MACGSVAQSEGAISLASLNLTRVDLTSSTSSEKGETASNRSRKSIYRGDGVQDAILFLQKEHERVLSGLHNQVELLQKKCDDLQFDAHLKHISSNEEDNLRKKIVRLTDTVHEKDNELSGLKEQLEKQEKEMEEEKEQHRWKELKLEQQIEVSNQRTTELKAEIGRLKGQVHDLKVFSSALRTSVHSSGQERPPSSSRGGSTSPFKPPQSLHRTSQESLDSLGPRSLGSEEGDVGMWREARVGSSVGKFVSQRGCRPLSSHSVQPGSLPPISSSTNNARPSSSFSSVFALPPISKSRKAPQSQGANRPHVRRQLRLLSAPNLDFATKATKQPP